METNKKVRQSNFELMRIISMFMIVLWHVIIYGKGLANADSVLSLNFDIIKSIIVVHVNSFILVTGYFQCDSKFKIKKVLNLLFTSWFYRVLFLIIAICFFLATFTNL